MDLETVKQFFDSCHEAKRITELMPQLPSGLSARHIHVIDVIQRLSQKNSAVKVSDVSQELQVTRPSITRLINDLEQLQVVTKTPDHTDKRIIWLQLTPLGEQYYDFYIDKYHNWVAVQLAPIAQEQLNMAAQAIHQAYQILNSSQMDMSERPSSLKHNGGTTQNE